MGGVSIFQNLHSKITNNMPRTPHPVKSLNTVYPNVYFNSYKCIFFISFFEYCLIEEYIKYRVTIRKWHSLIMRNQRKYCHVSQYVSSFRFQCSIKTRFLIKHLYFPVILCQWTDYKSELWSIAQYIHQWLEWYTVWAKAGF